MRKRIMVTTLFNGENVSDNTYYYSKGDNGKVQYCDAMLPAEAACKYMLSTYRIDEVVILGTDPADIPPEGIEAVALREGRSFFASDLKKLSRYDLLRYRLAEYAEELRAEYQDNHAQLTAEEQKKTVTFVRRFFSGRIRKESENRLNRYFHLLTQDHDLEKAFYDALRGWQPKKDYERYKAWALHYLYQKLKETGKMEFLDDNAEVRIRFVPVKEGESFMFPQHMEENNPLAREQIEAEGMELFVCMPNSEASVILDIMNMINMTKVFPKNKLGVSKIIAISSRHDSLAEEISDRTNLQNISELLSAATAFVNYGKTAGIVSYWKQANIDNPKIEQIIYAMRNIDNGISLCDINDIERGIRSLRLLFSDMEPVGGNSPIEHVFGIILQEGVRRDYGRLLETDQIQFIDLVRWAYRKEFWQQTLTLIESRAPIDFIERGFYYYCDSQEYKDKVARIIGQIYFDLKPHEKYKVEDLPHYYVKFYNRSKVSRQKDGKEYIQSYARQRVKELDSQEANEIRACTICPDRSALEDLLFAYYYLGNVRNTTAHAEESFDGFFEIMECSDSSERMEMIRQSVKYFLHCYDKVTRLSEGRKGNVIQITSEDYMKYADELREQLRHREK